MIQIHFLLQLFKLSNSNSNINDSNSVSSDTYFSPYISFSQELHVYFSRTMPGLILYKLQQRGFIGIECVCLTGLPAVQICLLLKMYGASWRRESDNGDHGLLISSSLAYTKNGQKSIAKLPQLISSIPKRLQSVIKRKGCCGSCGRSRGHAPSLTRTHFQTSVHQSWAATPVIYHSLPTRAHQIRHSAQKRSSHSSGNTGSILLGVSIAEQQTLNLWNYSIQFNSILFV